MNPTTPTHRFATGALPSPRRKLLAATPHLVTAPPPPQFAVFPKKLSYWDNERDGVCVSSEEAFAKVVWSTWCNLPDVFATEKEVHDFAAHYGWLNGASLSDVLDVMVSKGMPIGGTVYKDGGYNSVDYGNESALQSALTVGPVKIAIDAGALPSGAGNGSGWFAVNGGHYRNTNHCVGVCGYGPAEFIYKKLNEAGLTASPTPPPGAAGKSGYGLFTWGSIGFVTHDWLDGTCTEAWVRSPTTAGENPAPAVLDWAHIL